MATNWSDVTYLKTIPVSDFIRKRCGSPGSVTATRTILCDEGCRLGKNHISYFRDCSVSTNLKKKSALNNTHCYIELDAPICNFPFRKQWYIAMGSGSCIRSGERDITVPPAHPKWEVRKVQRQGGVVHAQFLYLWL